MENPLKNTASVIPSPFSKNHYQVTLKGQPLLNKEQAEYAALAINEHDGLLKGRDAHKHLSAMLDELLVCYRVGRNPGSLLDKLKTARAAVALLKEAIAEPAEKQHVCRTCARGIGEYAGHGERGLMCAKHSMLGSNHWTEPESTCGQWSPRTHKEAKNDG